MSVRLIAVLSLLLCSPAFAESPRVDAFGDPLPPGATMRLGSVRFEHTAAPGYYSHIRFALSPDGAVLATWEDQTIHFWAMPGGRKLRSVPLEPEIGKVVFSPDGRLFAAGVRDAKRNQGFFTHFVGDVLLGEVATGKVVARFGSALATSFETPAFSPDGKWLAYFRGDMEKNEPGELVLWDVAAARETCTVQGRTFAFSADARVLATGDEKGTVTLWDPRSGGVRGVCRGPSTGIESLAFSPDGRTVAAGVYLAQFLPGRVGVWQWDVASGKELRRLETGPVGGVHVAFSADGATLAASTGSQTVHIWDAATGRTLHRSGRPKNLSEMSQGWSLRQCRRDAFSADGKTFWWVEDFNTVGRWDVAARKEIGRWTALPTYVDQIAVTPDGAGLICSGNYLAVCDAVTGRPWLRRSRWAWLRSRAPWPAPRAASSTSARCRS
jgi:WD40 repeat protein